jgi:glycosyltransferase involved in cell wall biosynthesis
VYTAVEAFRKLELSVPGSRLLIFGECDVSVQDQGKSERIELRGRVPHRELLRSLVEEVDIWLHPSRIESHGIVICEAIQAGCPVIAGKNSGAVSWTLEYGRAGILVDIESIDEVSAAMRRTVLERDAYNDMVDYGREHIRTMFSVERTTGMHLKYYRDIAGR